MKRASLKILFGVLVITLLLNTFTIFSYFTFYFPIFGFRPLHLALFALNGAVLVATIFILFRSETPNRSLLGFFGFLVLASLAFLIASPVTEYRRQIEIAETSKTFNPKVYTEGTVDEEFFQGCLKSSDLKKYEIPENMHRSFCECFARNIFANKNEILPQGKATELFNAMIEVPASVGNVPGKKLRIVWTKCLPKENPYR